jgi:hypothetical protein
MTSEGANGAREHDDVREASSMEDKFSFSSRAPVSGAELEAQVTVLLLYVSMQYLTTTCMMQTLQALEAQLRRPALWFLTALQHTLQPVQQQLRQQ